MSDPLWAGRLQGGLDPVVLDFTASLAFDRRLLADDLRASAVHVRMLARQGLVDAGEADRIVAALAAVEVEPDAADEDVHSAIERLLGDLGPRVHAGRSRNDQVQTAMRLWVKRTCAQTSESIAAMACTLVARARVDGDAVMPGYTHGQRAQPVWLGHHLAAHGWALVRDRRRFGQVLEAADVCPLGAGALAGSSLPLDPVWVAAELGFARSFDNSLDAVSDRDYVAGFVYAGAMCMLHLSRLAEELVLWTSSEYGFAELDDRAATGSSMMPQKKNPDVAELTRGKAGTAVGRLAGLLAMLKGLPLAYNRDLQEDKRAAFDQADDLLGALAAMRVLVEGLRFDPERMRAAAADGRTVATDVAEQLVREGMPFRRAHAEVAARVAAGERFDIAPERAAAARLPAADLRAQLDRLQAALDA
ncbi:MAG TPA: argininosuccinate lyase [Gaiellales bacterium]|nr:argininosuccinate lyase [Gaiellales bacterium]